MALDSLFTAMNISSTGLRAQRIRMNIIADNIANADTTRGPKGTCYQRQEVVFSSVLDQARSGRGVAVSEVSLDKRPPVRLYNPDHPDAKGGYVEMPNVNVVEEMVDMMAASRSYEANVMAIKTARGMALKALEIGRS